MSRTDSSTPAIPTRVIEPRRGWLAVNWGEIWHFREMLYFLTWRDVKVRYKQTILGVLWAFIQPFLKMVVFTVIFGKLAKIDFGENIPYAVGMYAGLLPWQFFSEALSRSSSSVAGSGNLISKVYFPRLIIPIASVGACLIDFLVSFAILVGLMFYYGITPSHSLLAIAPLVLLTILAALGAGVLLSALNVAYRDFQYVIPFGIQIWMFATPVIYPVRIFPEQWHWLVSLNPMTGIVDAYRSAILGRPFAWDSIAISLLVTAVIFLFGIFFFRRVESRFADIV